MNRVTVADCAGRSWLQGCIGAVTMLLGIASGRSQANVESNQRARVLPNESQSNIWMDDIGSGFRAEAQSMGLSFGGSYGLAKFGSKRAHDLALGSLSYSHILGNVSGQGWYRGNWEVQAELFWG